MPTPSTIIGQIESSGEDDRRQTFRRRGRIYKDGGRDFLIEYLENEFGKQAMQEMRLAPVNVLKSLVDRKSVIYARPAIRVSPEESDQQLVDYYVDKLAFDSVMQKANRYYNLYSNTELYVLPKVNKMDGTKHPEVRVMPPWLYSVVPNFINETEKDWVIFSNFTSQDDGLGQKQVIDVSSIETGKNTKNQVGIDNKGESINQDTMYIFWSDNQHFTTMGDGVPFTDENNQEGINPIGMIPSVTLRKDVDNEFWAMQGEDMVDMAIATQLMLTDQLTIAKMQGFALLVLTGSEEPHNLEIGLQKSLFLKTRPDEPTPTVSYVNSNAPLAEYSSLADRILEICSTTNLLPPNIFSGGTGQVNSGIQEMIKNSATLMEIEAQKPVLRDTELETWIRIAAWHNLLHDKNELPDDLRVLGKFSDDFSVQVSYQDMKPVESEEERQRQVQFLLDNGLTTRKDAFKKLNPEMTDDQIEATMQDIEDEKVERMEKFGVPKKPLISGNEESEDEQDEEDGQTQMS